MIKKQPARAERGGRSGIAGPMQKNQAWCCEKQNQACSFFCISRGVKKVCRTFFRSGAAAPRAYFKFSTVRTNSSPCMNPSAPFTASFSEYL